MRTKQQTETPNSQNITELTEVLFIIKNKQITFQINKRVQIFNIKNNFTEICIETFNFQYTNNQVYKSYVDYLDIDVKNVNKITEIPFLPIDFFKTHKVVSLQKKEEIIFTSSGTTGFNTSKHYVSDLNIYKQNFIDIFTRFYGKIQDYVILALLPSYLERDGSSLIYMTEELIKLTKNEHSGFFLNNFSDLHKKLQFLHKKNQKTILLGVSFALLDFFEEYKMQIPNTIIMETGGMKGRKKEIVREELHKILKSNSGVSSIHSEYGMTELLSQAYSQGDSIFELPPQMRVLIRDTNDPFYYLEKGKSGGINIIDLANINSCSFIETKDLGRMHSDNSFEVLGRFDNSDVRGCNLLVL